MKIKHTSMRAMPSHVFERFELLPISDYPIAYTGGMRYLSKSHPPVVLTKPRARLIGPALQAVRDIIRREAQDELSFRRFIERHERAYG